MRRISRATRRAGAYDVGADAMAFDIDVRWESELVAEIDVYPAGGGRGAPRLHRLKLLFLSAPHSC